MASQIKKEIVLCNYAEKDGRYVALFYVRGGGVIPIFCLNSNKSNGDCLIVK